MPANCNALALKIGPLFFTSRRYIASLADVPFGDSDGTASEVRAEILSLVRMRAILLNGVFQLCCCVCFVDLLQY
jgi:hypothetical protein